MRVELGTWLYWSLCIYGVDGLFRPYSHGKGGYYTCVGIWSAQSLDLAGTQKIYSMKCSYNLWFIYFHYVLNCNLPITRSHDPCSSALLLFTSSFKLKVDMLFSEDEVWAHPRIVNTLDVDIKGYWWAEFTDPIVSFSMRWRQSVYGHFLSN